MEKLYDRIIWHNGTTPAINETNLNKMSKALDDIDDRMIQIAGAVLVTVPQLQAMLEHTEDIMEQIEELSQNPPYIGANGNWYVWDTSTGAYTDSGVDASITVTIADVTALAPDAQPYVTNTGTSTDPVFHLFIPRGQTGKGISSIAKTGTSGYVDTYTITYTDNTSTTYTVTNGRNTDQVTTIPTASAALVGTIYQYIGASTSSYTHGFYYECVNDGGIYKWVNIPVGNDPVEITSSDPYTFRQGLGTMADMNIVGGTVGWNQLARETTTTYWKERQSSYGSISSSDNVLTYTLTQIPPSGAYRQGVVLKNDYMFDIIAGHKYLCRYMIKPSVTCDFRDVIINDSSPHDTTCTANIWNEISFIENAQADKRSECLIYPEVYLAVNDTYQLKNVNIIDLTLMFGSTIADRAYAMEQATSGSGIAWLKNMGFFTQDYYPYDAGSLKSVEGLQSRDVSGFNQWDEEWEVGGIDSTTGEDVLDSSRIRSKNYIPVIEATYYFTAPAVMTVLKYTVDKTFIGYVQVDLTKLLTFDETCKFIRFKCGSSSNKVQTYNHDICVNLSDTSKNGTYEPYHGRSYPLDSSITLRGIPKLDSNNKLYYDGDVYHADGSVERKYGIVDLGTLRWNKVSEYFHAIISNGSATSGTVVSDIICSAYKTTTGENVVTSAEDCIIGSLTNNSMQIAVHDSTKQSMSATDFKTAMSGVMLVYELATPTTELAKPFQNPQRAFSDGTEGFTMTGIVPVGNNTTYQLSKALIPAEDYTDGAVSVVQMEVDGKAGKDMISDAWVSGRAYSVRDYCIYEDVIYRCVQNVTQGTAILPANTSYWTPTKIAAEIKSAKSDSNFALLGIAALEESLTTSYHYNTDALSFLFQSYDSSVFPSVTNDDCVIVYGNIVLIHLSVGGDLSSHYMIGKIKDSMRPPLRGSTVYSAEVDTTMVITPLSGTAFDYSVVHVRIASNGDMIMSPFSTLKNNATGTFTLMYIKS